VEIVAIVFLGILAVLYCYCIGLVVLFLGLVVVLGISSISWVLVVCHVNVTSKNDWSGSVSRRLAVVGRVRYLLLLGLYCIVRHISCEGILAYII